YLSLGLVVYVLIFFRLNIIHDYYQIPFAVISAFYIGFTLDYLYEKINLRSAVKANIIISVLLSVLIINGIWYAERWYYKPDNLRLEASGIIEANTDTSDLVIVSISDTDPRDPRILSASKRYGWSIRTAD